MNFFWQLDVSRKTMFRVFRQIAVLPKNLRTMFGRKWAEEVHHPCWAAVAAITDKIGWLTGYRIREIRQLDDYAWRRATER